MYDQNYLIHHLRQSSVGCENVTFASTLDGKKISYGELFVQAEKVAQVLVNHGVNPGDRVAVQADKSLEQIQLYLGTMMAGAVFLPLNTAYTSQEIEYFINDAKPQIFICDPRQEKNYQRIVAQCGTEHLLTLDADGQGSLTGQVQLTSPGFKPVSRNSGDLAAILYTSGTTGRSKGAMLSHQNLWSNCDTLRKAWRFTSDDVLIHALPIFHSHGLFVATNTTLAAGSSLIFMAKFDADDIIDAIPNATALMGVPTFYTRLLKQEKLNKDYVANMRIFISGSAPLLAETHDQWQAKTGHAILERYGMTETNMNTSNPYDGERRAGTVGFPLEDVEIRIMDPETDQLLPNDEIGSIEVKGPNVFGGYWQMPDKTKEELREDGFFITGDLGKIDDDGYITIIGRSKDLVISGGFNVYPKELELLIDDMEGVNESAIIGVPHPDFGEAVIAIIVPMQNETLREENLKSHFQDSLAKYKQPKKYLFLEELPRNTMGKVQKNLLRETYKGLFTD
ncbi:malonate--CoA ligase [Curvivirga aplysinae]|uniref:malonate--CoA ligase n=1 Tax=Curvivirga aplysinae TaxID=2529852 RepID=UPI0012BC7945|nr:malonyl-CoA synthase [Curvivirga aplysinae]MTI10994.1 malonyl-CoA synthase [Curvivirga aplysinae]